jgi:hypothetical protein
MGASIFGPGQNLGAEISLESSLLLVALLVFLSLEVFRRIRLSFLPLGSELSLRVYFYSVSFLFFQFFLSGRNH